MLQLLLKIGIPRDGGSPAVAVLGGNAGTAITAFSAVSAVSVDSNLISVWPPGESPSVLSSKAG